MAINRAKLLESADKLVRQGKLDEAIRQYMALSEDNPRDVNTINRIGDLYVRLRKNREAIRQFMRIADVYDTDGFHLKAIAMYKKIAKLEPTHVEANERLADLYARQGLSTEARNQFLTLADQCMKTGQRPKAIQIYERVRDLEPNNIKIQLLLAELHGRDGEAGKAVEALLQVVRNLKSRGLTDEALKVAQKASKVQPSNPEVLSELAELLQSGGKGLQEVLGTLEALHKGEPENLRYLQMLAEAYLNGDRKPQYDELVAAAPSGEARAVLAEVESASLVRREEKGKAVQRLIRVAEEGLRDLEPGRVMALLEKAHQIDPDRPEVLDKILALATTASNREGMISASERLARLYVRQEAWERASSILGQLESLAPENPVVRELKPNLPTRPKSEEPPPVPEASSVPSLDELEKFVDLDSPADDSNLDAAISLEDEDPPAEAGDEVFVLPETEEESRDLSDSDEQEDAQDRAYSGKSVIQEMRGDPAEPEMDEDFLNEHFTEAEVFLKYGLVEKAREQLQTILQRYSSHLPSWEKLLEISLEEGKKAEAAETCGKIAALHRARGDEEKAKEREAQARELKPGASDGSVSVPLVPPPAAAVHSDLDLQLGMDPLGTDPEANISSVPPVAADAASPAEPKSSAPESALEEELSIEILEGPDPDRGSLSEEAISEKVSQIEFSLQQGLKEEAAEILNALERKVPEHPEVSRLRAKTARRPVPVEVRPVPPSEGDVDMDVERAFGRAPRGTLAPTDAPAPASAPAEEGFFDLAAELQAHAIDSAPEVSWNDPPGGLSPREEASIDEIFRAFRKKVDQQVEDEDYETRYNLGIAYKEMGLLDEAIGEFQYASRDPKLFLECCSILGICFREKGMSDLAIKWYRKALETTGYAEEKYQGLRYDLGELHLERGEFPQALSLFSEVYGTNSNYRDVATRIRELRKRVG